MVEVKKSDRKEGASSAGVSCAHSARLGVPVPKADPDKPKLDIKKKSPRYTLVYSQERCTSHVFCRSCYASIKLDLTKVSGGSTAPIISHATRSCIPIEDNKLYKEVQDLESRNKSAMTGGQGSNSAASAHTGIDAALKKQLDQSVVEYFVASGLPFHHVDTTPFRSFCASLCPGYSPPGRTKLGEDCVKYAAGQVQEGYQKIRSHLRSQDATLTASIDGWESPLRGRMKHQGISLFWIDDHFELNGLPVGLLDGCGESGSDLSSAMLTILDRIDPTAKQKLVAYTTGAAPNCQAMRVGNSLHVYCGPHALQLPGKVHCNNQAANQNDVPSVVREVLSLVQNVAKEIGNAKMRASYEVWCRANDRTPHQLPIRKDIRFNTCILMIEAYIREHGNIVAFKDAEPTKAEKVIPLEDAQLELAADILKVLAPCGEATRILEKDSTTASMYLPAVEFTRTQLQAEISDYCEVEILKDALGANLAKVTAGKRACENEALLIATLLHPRFSNFAYDVKSRNSAINALTAMAHSLPILPGKGTAGTTKESGKKEGHVNWMTRLMAHAHSLPDSQSSVQASQAQMVISREERIANEITDYEVIARVERNKGISDAFDLRKWWRDHAGKFPEISRVVKRVLGVVPSICYQERTFSQAKFVCTPIRNRLKNSEVLVLAREYHRIKEGKRMLSPWSSEADDIDLD